MIIKPIIIKGGIHQDGRGEVRFVNDFDFSQVKRFYTIRNSTVGYLRAWHGHRYEVKSFYILKGIFRIFWVKIDDWKNPSPSLKPESIIMSEKDNDIVTLPGGYANGLMAKSDDARLMVFSNYSLEESSKDDYRFENNYWNVTMDQDF
jgi:dTDP-4-dehydrorhamnose 3,5-epimerase-like enzyme